VLRDPGGDLAGGFVTTQPKTAWPLTEMARVATSGQSGINLDGYRDFRGVRVAGAWRWLSDYHIGVATEIFYNDAYATLATVRRGFGFLVGVLALLAVFGFVSSLSIYRLRSEVSEARRFGQYRLEEVIGEGGMAKVHRAQHATLQRPVAIKLLEGNALEADDVARFEREVKLVSQLSHKNTIQIFDYGQADDGTLFYVMELVPGINLSQLVGIAGALPPGRVISILRQVCGSLSEAHALGIVHRDIKPANIMICSRTDGADIVKVLDFGLARTMAIASAPVTRKELLGGTPVYIAPERIQDPTRLDTRSDIYALGAVAFYLLTGREIVEGGTPQEILLKTIQTDPPRPSSLASNLPPELDRLVSSCLAPEPERRPQTASTILEALDSLGSTLAWTHDDAHEWWQRYWAGVSEKR
jgi:serine/threonine-protein kinase